MVCGRDSMVQTNQKVTRSSSSCCPWHPGCRCWALELGSLPSLLVCRIYVACFSTVQLCSLIIIYTEDKWVHNIFTSSCHFHIPHFAYLLIPTLSKMQPLSALKLCNKEINLFKEIFLIDWKNKFEIKFAQFSPQFGHLPNCPPSASSP